MIHPAQMVSLLWKLSLGSQSQTITLQNNASALAWSHSTPFVSLREESYCFEKGPHHSLSGYPIVNEFARPKQPPLSSG